MWELCGEVVNSEHGWGLDDMVVLANEAQVVT